jgi:hypothetical protein
MVTFYFKSALAALLLFSGFTLASEQDFVTFDFDDKQMQNGSDGFSYVGSEGDCAKNRSNQGRLCKLNGERLYIYYSPYSSAHMGYLRTGTIFLENARSISNNALGVTLTGGSYLDENGDLINSGLDIREIETYQTALSMNDPELYSFKNLPGWAAIFYGMPTTTTPISKFEGANRFSVWVWYPSSPDRHARFSNVAKDANSPQKTLSWYTFIDDSRGDHYYHTVTNRAYGGWVKVNFDAHPSHNNAQNNYVNKGFPSGGFDAPYDPLAYFKRITAFSLVFSETAGKPSPYTFSTDEWKTNYQPYENEETISNVGIGFDPEFRKFDISFEDKYKCGECAAQFQLTYSFNPITNENVAASTPVISVQNFFVEHDNVDNLIVKPKNGYNQVWAGFGIEKQDLYRFMSGETIYFSVVDKSTRNYAHDPKDDELVLTASGASVKRVDLVKTISYDYHKNTWHWIIEGPSSVALSQSTNTTVNFPVKGMSSSVTYTVTGNDDFDWNVLKTSKDSVAITFSSNVIGAYDAAIEARGEDGELLARKVIKVYIEPYDCRVSPSCHKKMLVNFHHSNEASTMPYREWNTILSDKYVGYSATGIGTVSGSNGDYNYQGVSGTPLPFDDLDVVRFSIKNIGDVPFEVMPAISSESSGRRNAADWWVDLRPLVINAGERMFWNVPVKDFVKDRLDTININIPNSTQRLRVEGITLISEKESVLTSKENLLVDFYQRDNEHVFDNSPWNTVFKDRYTGSLSGGAGIVVGADGGYNFQGVSGSPLFVKTITLEWFNTSKNRYTFSPRISFDDQDRVSYGVEDKWITLPEVTLEPYARVISTIEVNAEIKLINTNVNVSQPGEIALDRITYQ